MDLMKACVLTCAMTMMSTHAQGAVKLPAMWSSDMVLQQQSEARFVGKATPGADVTIVAQWQKTPLTVKAGADGRWSAKIKTPEGGKKSYTLEFTDGADGESLTLENIVIGEVWLCSGQSNMEMPVAGWGKVKDYEKEMAAADAYPWVRLLHVKRHTSVLPREDTVIDNGGGWRVCSPEAVEHFSAIGYFFGRQMEGELDVPIGIIDCTWGGSPVECWVSYQTLSRGSGFEGVVLDFMRKGMDEQSIRRYYQALVDSASAGKDFRPEVHPDAYAHKSGFPATVDNDGFLPCELFNAMLLPLTRMDIRGVLWYQGEQNADRPDQYACLFPAMITEWRTLWSNPGMPFYFVQLANYRDPKEVEPHSEWGYLREAQASALHLPATGMAIATDVGEAKDIHPKNKQEVARRLALLALNRTYGKNVVCSAPEYAGYTIVGNEIHIDFNAKAADFAPTDGEIDGFIIAGHDGRFYKGVARKEGDRIAVSSPEVKYPVAVRYCWADNPEIGLRGKTGLPVAPFRTDNW